MSLDVQLTQQKSQPINLDQAKRIRSLLSKDEAQSRCKDIMTRSLFMFGLKAKGANPGFDKFVNIDFNRLAIDAYLDKNVQGFSLYTFVPYETGEGELKKRIYVPQNVAIDHNITINKILNKDWSVETEVVVSDGLGRRNPEDTGAQKIFYYEWPAVAPSLADGGIRSQLAPFVEINETHLMMKRCLTAALIQSSHPPVLYQESPNKQDISETTLSIAYAETWMGNMVEEQEKNHQYEIQKSSLDTRQFNHAKIPRDSILNQALPPSQMGQVRFYPTPIDNYHMVPPGMVVAPAIPPAIPQPNFLDFEAAKDRKVALAWGIPPSIALADSQKSSASGNSIGDNDLEFYAKTVQNETKLIIDFMNDVLRNFLRISTGSTTVDYEDDMFELPTIPWISTRALYEAHNQDLISFETLQTHMLRINGLSESDRATQPNIHRRPPPGGSENMTTAMIEARVNNINAESFEKRQKALLTKEERINGPVDGGGEDPEMQEIELKIKDKELEMAELKLKHMDKQIALQKVKNQAPKPSASAGS